ncbi:MAG: DNA mismatch repair endonuclease MutL [Anaerolineales bacterium]|nr:DNA mismatch repair endonuclease MutL [Anaerolineales bacterium]
MTLLSIRFTLSGMPIQVLPDELASQIAAGEVVERPASVVKELLENALDAGASQISIRVLGAGQELIEVSDDGRGIPADELPLALQRHATSKLSRVEDLAAIRTLGFRGEALAALGSVGRLTLISRPSDSAGGAQVQADGGRLGQLQATPAAPGTVVQLADLFFNTPARRKFLKSEPTERRHISTLVACYALAYPQVRFSLEMEGRPTLHTSGNGDRREVLSVLYDAHMARRMLQVDAPPGAIQVEGFISPLDVTRSNRSEMTFFVNGRWVHDPALSSAVLQAYRGMLMVGRFPLVVLFLQLPPEMVDVNVHPTKAEVRFADRDAVFSALQRAVRRALLAYSPLPTLEPVQAGLAWRPLPVQPEPLMEEPVSLGLATPEDDETPPQAQPALPGSGVPLLRLVGQVGAAYLVAEGPDGLYLVDQHAAHERVLFERFQAQRAQIASQTLLEPATVQLSPAQAQLLEPQLNVLSGLGFEVEPFGPQTYRVRAIPALLLGSDPEAALRAVVEDFEEDETPLEREIEARLIARICKRAAVKAGQSLSPEEQRQLLLDLEACQAPRTCPHGRPTMIHLAIDMLERQFGRRGVR